MELTDIPCPHCTRAPLYRYWYFGTPYFRCAICLGHFEAVLRPGRMFRQGD